MWTGADTFLAACALCRGDDARVPLERSFTDHLLGTSRDAFPARLTLMDIQPNKRCRIAADQRVALHGMTSMTVEKKLPDQLSGLRLRRWRLIHLLMQLAM